MKFIMARIVEHVLKAWYSGFFWMGTWEGCWGVKVRELRVEYKYLSDIAVDGTDPARPDWVIMNNEMSNIHVSRSKLLSLLFFGNP